jgi:hypothetical protein
MAERQKNQHVDTTPPDRLGVTTYQNQQASQLAAAQLGTANPGDMLEGTAAPTPPHQVETFGPQFSDAALESLHLLDGPSYNKWPVD